MLLHAILAHPFCSHENHPAFFRSDRDIRNLVRACFEGGGIRDNAMGIDLDGIGPPGGTDILFRAMHDGIMTRGVRITRNGAMVPYDTFEFAVLR